MSTDPAPAATEPTAEPPPPSLPLAVDHGRPELALPDRLVAISASSFHWLMQPRVRVAVAGVLLLLIGGLMMANSVWTLPLVIIGALMVIVAWIGHRLEGRFTVEWGPTGTEMVFRATIKPAQSRPQPSGHAVSAGDASRHLPQGPEVIEGEAHTVEIDAAELRALVAAAQAAPQAPPPAHPQLQEIQIRRNGATSAPSPAPQP